MRKINDRNELNQYYNIVNSKFDDLYFSKKMRPSDIFNYVRNNMQEIKEEFGVEDVIGIEKIILDVVSHHLHSEKDMVLKFESFRGNFM